MALKKVSIIIPTLNDEKILPELFSNLEQLVPLPFEIIFVDGSSKDETACMIEEKGYKLIRVIGKSRALQLNEGAYHANGELIVFLHADTKVPSNLVGIVSETLNNKKITLAGFTNVKKGAGKIKKSLILQYNLKALLGSFIYNPIRCMCYGFRVLFWDQAMFCRKSDFNKTGGFNHELPVLENADLCLRINRLGRIKQLKERVYSSAGRMAAPGLFHAYSRYLKIYFFWKLGASPLWLKAQEEDMY